MVAVNYPNINYKGGGGHAPHQVEADVPVDHVHTADCDHHSHGIIPSFKF